MTNETIIKTIIDIIYEENLALFKFLKEQKETSFESQFNSIFTKTLLLSAASYFEYRICKMVEAFIKRRTQDDECIVAIVKQKAIKRQYHTYFDWDGKNANKFFSLFGNTFKEERVKDVNADAKLKSAIESFLELGSERNNLVHGNFADYPIPKTAEEVYELYQKATVFIDFLDRQFNIP